MVWAYNVSCTSGRESLYFADARNPEFSAIGEKPVNTHEKARDRLIVALDLPSVSQALSLMTTLRGHVGIAKIGLQLFVSGGRGGTRAILEHAPVMLDLKLHDIPATMTKALQVAAEVDHEALSHGLQFLTVHTAAGPKALEACRKRADTIKAETGRAPKILGVTVLTSLDSEDLKAIGIDHGNIEQTVIQRARLARECGLDGLVCSGQEVQRLRVEVGDSMDLVVPGIRPAGGDVNDQARVMTPTKAITVGADYLVVGRSITGAEDPVAAAQAIVDEIRQATPVSE
jgi:orotidine-5'-phosphate decarboxylase